MVYNGFSNYPYPLTTQNIQDVIDLMEKHGLNVYRISIRPSYSEGSHPYLPRCIVTCAADVRVQSVEVEYI